MNQHDRVVAKLHDIRAHVLSKPERIVEEVERLLPELREVGDGRLLCQALRLLAFGKKKKGQYAEAVSDLISALKMSRRSRFLAEEAECIVHLSELLLQVDDNQDAVDLCEMTMTKLPDGRQRLILLLIAGQAFLSMKDIEQALTYFSKGMQLANKLHAEDLMYACIHFLGKVAIEGGRYSEARDKLMLARRHYGAGEHTTNLISTEIDISRSFVLEGREQEALHLLESTLRRTRIHQLATKEVDTNILLAQVAQMNNQRDTVLRYLGDALCIAEKQSSTNDLLRVHSAYRKYYDQIGDEPSRQHHELLERQISELREREREGRIAQIRELLRDAL